MVKNTKKIQISVRKRIEFGVMVFIAGVLVLVFIYRNLFDPTPVALANMHESAGLLSLILLLVTVRGTFTIKGSDEQLIERLYRTPMTLSQLLVVDLILWNLFEAELSKLPAFLNMWFVLPMIIGIFVYCGKFAMASIRKDTLERNVHQLLSENVAKELTREDNSENKTGGLMNVTVLFCRAHEFERRLKEVDTARKINLFRHFLIQASEILEKHGGTVLEFPGHCVLCVFGAPTPCEGHEASAVRAALEIQKEMKALGELCETIGVPAVEAGIGISSGFAHVGSIGGEKQKRFSVIGRNVNITSRIESYTKDGEILISEGTKNRLGGEFSVSDAGTILPKGMASEIRVYRVEEKEAE